MKQMKQSTSILKTTDLFVICFSNSIIYCILYCVEYELMYIQFVFFFQGGVLGSHFVL